MQTIKLLISGMHCVACAGRITQIAQHCEGVVRADVNPVRGILLLTYEENQCRPDDVIDAIRKAGYGVKDAHAAAQVPVVRNASVLTWAMALTVCLSSVLMMLALRWQDFGFGAQLAGEIQAALALAVFAVNGRVIFSGIRSIAQKTPSMDALVTIGSLVSFAYSVWLLLNPIHHNEPVTAETLKTLYFDSSAMIYAFVGIGKWLEGRAHEKTRHAIDALAQRIPLEAVRLVEGREERVPASAIQMWDTVLVRAGETVPADGLVLEGEAEVDESSLTGESVPVLKHAEDKLFCSTRITSGWVKLSVSQAGAKTQFSRIMRLVDEASSTQAPIERLVDKVCSVFVPFVFGCSGLVLSIWFLAHESLVIALPMAVSVLVIACPCAMGLATPTAITIATAVGARNNLFFKSAKAIEATSQISHVIFDKTGTLTEGAFEIASVDCAKGFSEDEVLALAASVEQFSAHPLAKAIRRAAQTRGLTPKEAVGFSERPGCVSAHVGNQRIDVGNAAALKASAKEPLSNPTGAKTQLVVLVDGRWCATLSFRDKLRSHAKELIDRLKELGIEASIASGDSQCVVDCIAGELGIRQAHGNQRPEDKLAWIEKLRKQGRRVLFVGDGINDAPALALADVGIAVGAGTDVAIESADVVLVGNRLEDILACITLSRAVTHNIRQNLLWAVVYNVIGMLIAAGVLYPTTGWMLDPMFAAAAMSLSSLGVVGNAMRLFGWQPTAFQDVLPPPAVVRTRVRVEGMACEACSYTVQEALQGIVGVQSVTIDASGGFATLESTVPLLEADVRKAVEEKGFRYIDMRTV